MSMAQTQHPATGLPPPQDHFPWPELEQLRGQVAWYQQEIKRIQELDDKEMQWYKDEVTRISHQLHRANEAARMSQEAAARAQQQAAAAVQRAGEAQQRADDEVRLRLQAQQADQQAAGSQLRAKQDVMATTERALLEVQRQQSTSLAVARSQVTLLAKQLQELQQEHQEVCATPTPATPHNAPQPPLAHTTTHQRLANGPLTHPTPAPAPAPSTGTRSSSQPAAERLEPSAFASSAPPRQEATPSSSGRQREEASPSGSAGKRRRMAGCNGADGAGPRVHVAGTDRAGQGDNGARRDPRGTGRGADAGRGPDGTGRGPDGAGRGPSSERDSNVVDGAAEILSGGGGGGKRSGSQQVEVEHLPPSAGKRGSQQLEVERQGSWQAGAADVSEVAAAAGMDAADVMEAKRAQDCLANACMQQQTKVIKRLLAIRQFKHEFGQPTFELYELDEAKYCRLVGGQPMDLGTLQERVMEGAFTPDKDGCEAFTQELKRIGLNCKLYQERGDHPDQPDQEYIDLAVEFLNKADSLTKSLWPDVLEASQRLHLEMGRLKRR